MPNKLGNFSESNLNHKQMEKQKKYGGRKIDYNPIYFIYPSHMTPESLMIYEKFGHMGIVLQLAISQHLCQARYFLLKMDAKFYATLKRDYGIAIETCNEVLEFIIDSTDLYDKYLFDQGFIFSVDFLRNFHKAKYFRDRKYSANDILSAVNKLRDGQEPLTLKDEIEKLMDLENQNDITNTPDELNYPE